MPVVDLQRESATAEPWDVLFQLGYDRPEYVDHLGLFGGDEAMDGVSSKTNLPMDHVQPCYIRTHESSELIGKVQLTADECGDIATFVEGVRNEKDGLRDVAKLIGEDKARNQLFRLHPCFSKATDEFAYRRFSCVGFVIMAYDSICIRLLSWPLPDVVYDDLVNIGSDDFDRIRDATTREYLGIIDDGPMQFVFPGYVLHSMNRAASDIRNAPYSPQRGDAYYPSESNTTA